jgi:hypothetical protein
MKVIPYTTSTGVKIGLRWNESPKPMPIDDPDMETIQGWFICKPEWHKARNLDRIVYIWSTIFALLILITVSVFK